MNTIKLLIVDDEEDNRIVLHAICKKLEGFEIQMATNGLEAVEKVEAWQPEIVLMDMMMPDMDGYEASKIIKKMYPDTVVIAVTASQDAKLEEKMYAIGVQIYLHKPVERSLIRYKLQSIAAKIRKNRGIANVLSAKKSVNPFNHDIRSFKIIFDVDNNEAIMDFGIWMFDQNCGKSVSVSQRYDKTLELLYRIMTQAHKESHVITLIIEESHEEYYINIQFEENFNIGSQFNAMFQEFGEDLFVDEKLFCLRLLKPDQEVLAAHRVPKVNDEMVKMEENTKEEVVVEEQKTKETRLVDAHDQKILRQSFVNKTSAVEYINELGGDVLEEIMDLASVDEEWQSQLAIIETEMSTQSLRYFTSGVLSAYIGVINNLFEFTGLAYALTSLSLFLNDNAQTICEDEKKLKTLVMLLELLGADLRSWKEHIFETQTTNDIHYLDSSFFSSCMQIEEIISDKALSTDDDNDMEFF